MSNIYHKHKDGKETIPVHLDVGLIMQAIKILEAGMRENKMNWIKRGIVKIRDEIDRAVQMEKSIGSEQEGRITEGGEENVRRQENVHNGNSAGGGSVN